MSNRALSLTFVGLLLGFVVGPARLHAGQDSWDRVLALPTGAAVAITVDGGRPENVLIVSMDAAGLTIARSSGGVREDVPRRRVVEIAIEHKGNRAGRIAGLAIVGGGIVIGLSSHGRQVAGPEPDITGGKIAGAVIIAIGGATMAIASRGSTRDVIYRRP